MADKYILRITAGSDYDDSRHVEVPVNQPETVRIDGAHASVELNVRVQGYNGLPAGSPSTSAYFAAEPHATNKDQYSIAFRFTPTQPPSSSGGISGADLQFGNDFDRPIRDRLPPGFNTALRIVKWWIDPGLDGDAYADKPHLYGPALSSFNVLELGAGEHHPTKGGLWFEEGGDEAARETLGLPDTGKERMKWALNDANKEKFVFEYGKTYGLDFFNPYLDFANLALRLPGFQLSIANYWDGQALRYVLRNKATGDVYLVVVFSLFLREDLNEDGTLKEGAQQHTAGGARAETRATDTKPTGVDEHSHDDEAAMKQARDELGAPHHETSADDVD
ncbi:Bax-like protein [Cordyceps javanica]|uniref:Bax-like protein n=1 Tax=Cordyceps javanica TaxID=43265 RepID=A0A545V5L7_9HYPO|nr:Bax-like protein [Cordyceps javanica]TQW08268.1 Bax-like protein [Cordyceps javanica]